MNRARRTGTMRKHARARGIRYTEGNKRGACVKVALKDVGSCWSGCALLLEGTQAHGVLGT